MFSAQLYNTLWILSLFIYLIVFIVFVAVFIGSIIFLILNRKEYSHAAVPFYINLWTIIVICTMPSDAQNKLHHLNADNLCKYKDSNCPCNSNLYLDYYVAYLGGATSTDVNAVYLTDCKNFRLYLGTYNEGENFSVKIKGDIVFVAKTSTEYISTLWSDPIVLDQQRFSLTRLKSEHVFQ